MYKEIIDIRIFLLALEILTTGNYHSTLQRRVNLDREHV